MCKSGSSCVTVAAVAEFLEKFAPLGLAEEWDNVGLLVGDPRAEVSRLMTCLTISPATVAEAVRHRAEMIVAHHPLPFRPLRRLTSDTTPGRMLLELIAAGIAVYSPHTAFDSAAEGINQRLALGIGLEDVRPLLTRAEAGETDTTAGAGRWGRFTLPLALDGLVARVKDFLAVEHLQLVGNAERTLETAAVACGSAGEFLQPALELGCDCLVLGETSFHTCLEAEAAGIALVMPGHFASERFAVEQLAQILSEEFSPQRSAAGQTDMEIWASRQERDPIGWA